MQGGAVVLLLAALLALAAPVLPVAAAERIAGTGWSLTVDYPPGRGPFPAVILLPGCSGNTPPAVRAGLRSHARTLLAAGFAAATLDVLGNRSICADLGALTTRERPAAAAARSAAARLAAGKRIDGTRLGFIGQSFGGSVALRLASGASPFRAIAAYYPWCADGYGGNGRSNFRVPVLIMTGTADTWTPVSRCKALKPGPGSYPARIATYSGAVHSFDLTTLPRQSIAGVGGVYPIGGSASAAVASRSRYLGFLEAHLKRR